MIRYRYGSGWIRVFRGSVEYRSIERIVFVDEPGAKDGLVNFGGLVRRVRKDSVGWVLDLDEPPTAFRNPIVRARPVPEWAKGL